MRRRQRRLRSWLRHERMTVAMTLAEMTHHTAPRGPKMARVGEEVVHDAHDAPRGPKTPPPGVRPGSLAEPGPQRSDRSLRRSSGQTPLRCVPSLADAPAEAIGGRTLRYLLKAHLARKKYEEEEEKKYQERAAESKRRAQALLDHAASLPKRKRKKKRKKRLPKSSARHPLPSGTRTRKSGQYSTSPSFWQSPVQCPGVAWFNSGYSLCVSSQRLWISSLFSTCWTRILRSFLIFCILIRSLGIWQPLVRCLPCPGYTEKLDFLRDDFSHYFLRAPCIWQSLYCVCCCLWIFGLWIFREMTPGMVSVLHTPRFDSGYIFGVSLRSLLEEFHSYFNAMLGSTADTSLCVRLRRLVLLVTMHLALYSFVVFRPQMLVITAGMDQKECYVSPCRKLRIFRSCSSSQVVQFILSLRRGCVSRSGLFLDQEIRQLLDTMIDFQVAQVVQFVFFVVAQR